MIGTRKKLLLPLLALPLALGACDNVADSGASGLTIRLTDAPGDFAEAQVKIQQVYLQGDGGRVMLMEGGNEYVDLLTLAGGRTADLVKNAVVPAGTYSELRFVVCDAYVKTKDGKVYATQGAALPDGVTADGRLQAPSFCQSGLKVKLPGGSVSLSDEAKILVVDFDVSQSFGRQAGRSGMWVMHPVLRATDMSFSGNIAGVVTLAEGVVLPACGGADVSVANFVPRALVGTDAVASGLTAADGTYRIHFVSPNSYTMGYADRIGFANSDTLTFAATADPASVTVASGATAQANFKVTSATCKAAAPSSGG